MRDGTEGAGWDGDRVFARVVVAEGGYSVVAQHMVGVVCDFGILVGGCVPGSGLQLRRMRERL